MAAVWTNSLPREYSLDRIVLQTALIARVLGRHLSTSESREGLKQSLDASRSQQDQIYGEVRQDSALTALYADEAKDVIEKMKVAVDQTSTKFETVA